MRVFVKTDARPAGATGDGRLRLLLEGFWRQEIVPVDDIVRAIDRVPSFHLEGLREIVYLPEFAQAAAALPCPVMPHFEPKGEFVQRERRIFVYAFDSPGLLHQMLYHEIGHFVFFLVLGSRVKKRWVTEIFPDSRCVTGYARVNPWEDFAETYAYYLLHRNFLKNALPQKLAFMRDCVFSGKPDSLKQSDRD